MIDRLRRGLTRGNAQDVLRHGLSTALFCCLIAAALAISGRGPWPVQLIYSMSIGMVSWIVIEVGRFALSTDPNRPWPHGIRRVLLIVAGIAGGFIGGNAIGDFWTGMPLLEFRTFSPQKLASTLVITILACVAICYYYYAGGKSKFLEGEIAIAQRNATEARLKLLETQLEPHMLFNTLANLRVLISIDPPRAIEMLDRLNSYLRVTLSGSRTLAHPLAAEFDRLSDYLELMSIRMGPRLAYALELPADLRDVPVPPLLLQPLVENSIRHGLEPQVEGGRITVRAEREAELLRIDVIDTGLGLGEQLLAAPKAVDDRGDGGGFGLTQVRERLTAVFGERASLHLAAAPGGGACATLRFPLP
ncbi:Histidine kinase-, DNA gyrase B-, and HSP90-like ATPase [Burkholderiales bacterium 8X]|nr:Histidine kinase-, DNA gyrase B-, and HSP90-like ATPase [Burkholderiales bacterium 8X]